VIVCAPPLRQERTLRPGARGIHAWGIPKWWSSRFDSY